MAATWRDSWTSTGLLCLLLLGSVAPPVSGQAIRFEHITQQDGLSNTTVVAIAQDQQGFMWFGTHGGLDRYDGNRVTVYRHNPSDSTSIASNWIESLYVDRAGVLWVGTYGGGLNRFDAATETFTRYLLNPGDSTNTRHNDIAALYEDRQGMLWVGTHNGLARFDRETETFTYYQHDPNDPHSLSDNSVRALYEDRQGTLWIGTGEPWSFTPDTGGLNRFDRTTETFTRFVHDPEDEQSLIDNRVRAIYEDSRGTFWVGTWGDGLHSMNRETGTFTRYRYTPNDPDRLSRPHLRTNPEFSGTTFIHEDASGVLWVGAYNGGLNRFDPVKGTLSHYEYVPEDPFSLGSNNLWTFYESPDGVLWLGTFRGVSKIRPDYDTFRHYLHDPDDPSSLSHNIIRSIYEDQQGTLWIGTESGGLNRLDRQTGRFTRYQHNPNDLNSLSSDLVRSIYEDQQGTLWVGARGLNRLDRQTGRFTRYQHNPDDPNSLSSDAVTALHEDQSGSFWIGTFGGGLNKLDRQTGRFIRYPNTPNDSTSLSTSQLFALVGDRSGGLWMGHGNGLNTFDPATETFTAYFADTSGVVRARALYTDQAGIVWTGTEANGLYRIDPETGTAQSYTKENGLPSNTIDCILSDDEGNIWLSTTNGISRFTPRTLAFSNYSEKDGLQDNVFYDGACFKGAKGDLFFGGNSGLTIMRPEDLQKNTFIPPVALTSFKIFNEEAPLNSSLATTNTIRLSYLDKIISFEFAALDYAAMEKNQYAYQLEGFNDDWVSLGTRNDITFTNLNPGDYVLRVRGSNHHGLWNNEGLTINLHIAPPFWSTWWFRTLSLFGIAALLLALYRMQTQRIRARNRVLQTEIKTRRRIEQEREQLMRAMEVKNEELKTKNAELERYAYTVSHDLKNPLVTIRGFTGMLRQDAQRGDTERIEMDLQHIETAAESMYRLLEDLLELSRVGRVASDPEAVSLKSLTDETVALLAGRIEARGVRIDVQPSMPMVWGDQSRLQEVFQNLIDNAIKFTDNQAAPHIEIGAKQEGTEVICYVRDNGLGIAPEYHEKVFGLFDRLDQEIEGTGVGLALVKRIVEHHGGRIWVESEGEGHGSMFLFTLPVNAPQAQEQS